MKRKKKRKKSSLIQYQTVTTMNARTQAVPINVGTMITALVTENAPLGAGATENLTAMAHLFQICVKLTNHKTAGGPIAAGTPWNVTAIDNAQLGAGAMAPPTAEP